MTRFALLIALLVSVSACGGKDASPTSPGTSVFSLSGKVFGDGTSLAGASVTIMDGIHTGQTRTTDAAGNYSFTNLAPSGFTLQAAHPLYFRQNIAVNLTTANQSADFQIHSH